MEREEEGEPRSPPELPESFPIWRLYGKDGRGEELCEHTSALDLRQGALDPKRRAVAGRKEGCGPAWKEGTGSTGNKHPPNLFALSLPCPQPQVSQKWRVSSQHQGRCSTPENLESGSRPSLCHHCEPEVGDLRGCMEILPVGASGDRGCKLTIWIFNIKNVRSAQAGVL